MSERKERLGKNLGGVTNTMYDENKLNIAPAVAPEPETAPLPAPETKPRQTPARANKKPVVAKKPAAGEAFQLPVSEYSVRRTCGFHVYPEFELLIDALAKRNPKLKKKGEALEFLVNHYLGGLPVEKRSELIDMMNGGGEW